MNRTELVTSARYAFRLGIELMNETLRKLRRV